MKKMIAVIGLYFGAFSAFALQDTTHTASQITEIPAGLRIASASSIIYPGIAFGLEYPVQNIEFIKYKKNGSVKIISKQRFISLMIGYYHHKGFHDNFYFTPEWVMRRSKPNGWFKDFSAGLGYSRTFLGGTTYRVDNAGNVSIHHGAAYSYALIAAGLGLGYNFAVRKSTPLSVYSRLSMLAMFPYNSTVYPRPVLELGVIYRPRHFLLSRPKLSSGTKGRKP